MRAVILGSGPVGMTAAILLARHGHDVTLVDRDPGPTKGRDWDRVGVMQFHLPHAFRARARTVLDERLPDLFGALMAAGVENADLGLHARRSVFERAMWELASAEPRVTRLTGHVDDIDVADGVAHGVVVDSNYVDADLVVDASGRGGRLTAAYRPASTALDCGVAYACRRYVLRPGAEPGPTNGGPGLVCEREGFVSLLFTEDADHFTVLFVRARDDRMLAELRHSEIFEVATRLIPEVAAWVDPSRSVPVDRVRAGAHLLNEYRGQPTEVRRLLAIGDAVCTTNPMGARGVSLGFESAAALADIVATSPEEDWAARLDAWCVTNVRCWYDDHVATDAAIAARWRGEDIDVDGPVTWDLVAQAAQERPEFMRLLGPHLGMVTPPASIDPLREEVRSMLRDGWRPAPRPGATRDDLASAIAGALALPGEELQQKSPALVLEHS